MSITSAANNLKRTALSSWPKVLLYGDSLTQFAFSHDGCWGALLTDKLARKCDVVNRGFSGYNTRWNKLILPRIIDAGGANDVVAMTIFLGANDSVKAESNPRQHVPLDEYKQNLLDMVDYLMSIGISREKVVLITPPPCNEVQYTKHCQELGREMTKSFKQTEKYAEACSAAAQESGTLCVDLHTQMMRQKEWKSYLNDGLHLSQAGSAFLDSLLWPKVEKLTEHLPIILPAYDQIDYTCPEKSLVDVP